MGAKRHLRLVLYIIWWFLIPLRTTRQVQDIFIYLKLYPNILYIIWWFLIPSHTTSTRHVYIYLKLYPNILYIIWWFLIPSHTTSTWHVYIYFKLYPNILYIIWWFLILHILCLKGLYSKWPSIEKVSSPISNDTFKNFVWSAVWTKYPRFFKTFLFIRCFSAK